MFKGFLLTKADTDSKNEKSPLKNSQPGNYSSSAKKPGNKQIELARRRSDRNKSMELENKEIDSETKLNRSLNISDKLDEKLFDAETKIQELNIAITMLEDQARKMKETNIALQNEVEEREALLRRYEGSTSSSNPSTLRK